MYRVFRLESREKRKFSKPHEGKELTTREKLRNTFISGLHVLSGSFSSSRMCIRLIFFFCICNGDIENTSAWIIILLTSCGFSRCVLYFSRGLKSRLFKSKQQRDRATMRSLVYIVKKKKKIKYLAK